MNPHGAAEIYEFGLWIDRTGMPLVRFPRGTFWARRAAAVIFVKMSALHLPCEMQHT